MDAAATDADRDTLKAGLETLTQIKSFRQWYLGVPASTDRPVIDRTYAFSWLTIFDDEAAEATYQIDPIHLAFIKNYAHLWTRVQIYDALGDTNEGAV